MYFARVSKERRKCQIRSSYKEHIVNALALNADEGRD